MTSYCVIYRKRKTLSHMWCYMTLYRSRGWIFYIIAISKVTSLYLSQQISQAISLLSIIANQSSNIPLSIIANQSAISFYHSQSVKQYPFINDKLYHSQSVKQYPFIYHSQSVQQYPFIKANQSSNIPLFIIANQSSNIPLFIIANKLSNVPFSQPISRAISLYLSQPISEAVTRLETSLNTNTLDQLHEWQIRYSIQLMLVPLHGNLLFYLSN